MTDSILIHDEAHVRTITINRPDRMNALDRPAAQALLAAISETRERADIGVVILTAAGDRAFCTGADVKEFTVGSGYDGASWTGIGLPMEEIQLTIRALPQPVIAAVNGYAIGGGNVLQVVCDMSIAAATAKFGQVGPKYGSFDAGFGSALLARLVGERKAREFWFRCKTYTAQEALDMGLVNAVVAPEALMETARAWAQDVLALSPTALKMLKASFNADSDHMAGLNAMAFAGLKLYYAGPEAAEGHAAFAEKRAPDYNQFRRPDNA